MAEGAVERSSAYALRVRPVPGGAIVRDYIAGSDLSAFFSGHPSDPAAYSRKSVEVDARLDAGARMRVSSAIEPLGDAAQHLREIMAGNGYFITTGQQPALFGGPLYTLVKIVSAIRTAALAEQRLGKPVLALFWVGSDDHDWEEANHTSLLDGSRYVRRLSVRGAADAPPLPLYQRTWGGDVGRVIDELASLLPPAPFRDEVLRHVRSEYTSDATVSHSFTQTMRWLLRDQRVALVDSAHPAVRAAAVPVLQREIANHAEHTRGIAAQTAKLEAAGYTAQVAVAEDAANLMRIDEHGRDRLQRSARGWSTRRGGGSMAERDLIDDIAAHPMRYSPNVLLRPVVENAVFPTIAYVAGPGEISYFAQIGCLFEAHGIQMPVVVPRLSATIVDEKTSRKLAQLGIEPEALQRPFEDIVGELVRASVPPSVSGALESTRAALKREYEQLAAAAEQVDPTLRGPLIAARNRALLETNAAEKRIVSRMRERSATHIEQLRRLAVTIYPEGKPQDRVFGPLPLIAEYGPGLVHRLVEESGMDLPTVAAWTGPDCS